MPSTLEAQQREDEVMNEVTTPWTQLAAVEASLSAFVRAKRLGCLD
jgi:hypothetical protein